MLQRATCPWLVDSDPHSNNLCPWIAQSLPSDSQGDFFEYRPAPELVLEEGMPLPLVQLVQGVRQLEQGAALTGRIERPGSAELRGMVQRSIMALSAGGGLENHRVSRPGSAELRGMMERSITALHHFQSGAERFRKPPQPLRFQSSDSSFSSSTTSNRLSPGTQSTAASTPSNTPPRTEGVVNRRRLQKLRFGGDSECVTTYHFRPQSAIEVSPKSAMEHNRAGFSNTMPALEQMLESNRAAWAVRAQANGVNGFHTENCAGKQWHRASQADFTSGWLSSAARPPADHALVNMLERNRSTPSLQLGRLALPERLTRNQSMPSLQSKDSLAIMLERNRSTLPSRWSPEHAFDRSTPPPLLPADQTFFKSSPPSLLPTEYTFAKSTAPALRPMEHAVANSRPPPLPPTEYAFGNLAPPALLQTEHRFAKSSPPALFPTEHPYLKSSPSSLHVAEDDFFKVSSSRFFPIEHASAISTDHTLAMMLERNRSG